MNQCVPQLNLCILPFLSSSLKPKVVTNAEDGFDGLEGDLIVSADSQANFMDPSLEFHVMIKIGVVL